MSSLSSSSSQNINEPESASIDQFLDAVKHGNLDIVKDFITTHGVDAPPRETGGVRIGPSSLRRAAACGQLKIVRYLTKEYHVDVMARL